MRWMLVIEVQAEVSVDASSEFGNAGGGRQRNASQKRRNALVQKWKFKPSEPKVTTVSMPRIESTGDDGAEDGEERRAGRGGRSAPVVTSVSPGEGKEGQQSMPAELQGFVLKVRRRIKHVADRKRALGEGV